MKILLATSNPHKLDEIRGVLPGDAPIQWWTLSDLPRSIDEPVEDQATFEGNALLKARYYAKHSGLATIADDSGLEVDALGGEPGVISARYSGVTGPRSEVDPANNALLLQKLGDSRDRTARFVCAMAFVDGDHEHVVRGTYGGRIIEPSESPRGENGFGYDPIVYLPQHGKTAAELEPAEKNAISHRGEAVRLMWPHLQTRLGV